MADNKKQEPRTATESVYTIEQLTGAAGSALGVSSDVASTALRMAGKTAYTVPEAKRICREFGERRV